MKLLFSGLAALVGIMLFVAVIYLLPPAAHAIGAWISPPVCPEVAK